MTQILIVAPSAYCPAVSALKSERIQFEIAIPIDDYSYGEYVWAWWNHGESFLLLEHDIVPWPGAIQQLLTCDAMWCMHQYPIGQSGKLGGSLGLVKFSQRLIELHPDANLGWNGTLWNHLDAQVYGALQIDRGIPPHVHTPPVAHLTDMKVLAHVV